MGTRCIFSFLWKEKSLYVNFKLVIFFNIHNFIMLMLSAANAGGSVDVTASTGIYKLCFSQFIFIKKSPRKLFAGLRVNWRSDGVLIFCILM